MLSATRYIVPSMQVARGEDRYLGIKEDQTLIQLSVKPRNDQTFQFHFKAVFKYLVLTKDKAIL